MLKALRRLFAAETPPSDSKVTLADVLKNDWFELWYQPKIELKTTRFAGAEGLVRARHPTRGVLSPGLFLPGASESDMLALTERVLITALRDWEDCAAHGMSVKFNVNTPVSALMKLPITQIVRELRPKAENWPGLVLEVTEDEIIHDLKIANDVAAQLRAAHCTLALDDFGAGYSSLARVRGCRSASSRSTRYVTNCHIDKVRAACAVFCELGKRSTSRSWPKASSRCTGATSCALGCHLGQATSTPSRCRSRN
jgi:sensor c-di-GMP phosphodiesterase-like protein